MTGLNGRKVMIVGGSSGIGLGVACAAAKEGATVVLVGRSTEKLKRAQTKISAQSRSEIVQADMTREDEVASLFAEVGGFDHLVVTAGTPPPGDPIADTNLEFSRRFVDNKLLGAVLLAKHAAPRLNATGSMIFTSGINKDRPPVPGGAIVSAVAGSFSYFARALALELAPARVNVVSPGWVDTPMWDDLVGDAKQAYFAQMASRLPARAIPAAADVAAAYLYLMNSPFVTGETLRIDGGQSLV